MRIFNHPLTSPPETGAWVQLNAEEHRVIDEALACLQRDLMKDVSPPTCVIGGDYPLSVRLRSTFNPMWDRMKQLQDHNEVSKAV